MPFEAKRRLLDVLGFRHSQLRAETPSARQEPVTKEAGNLPEPRENTAGTHVYRWLSPHRVRVERKVVQPEVPEISTATVLQSYPPSDRGKILRRAKTVRLNQRTS